MGTETISTMLAIAAIGLGVLGAFKRRARRRIAAEISAQNCYCDRKACSLPNDERTACNACGRYLLWRVRTLGRSGRIRVKRGVPINTSQSTRGILMK